jgi:hypothetical protein
MSQTPITRNATFQESPDAAYARATRAMVRMGGKITQASAQSRVLSAEVHNAVVLNVLVEPMPDGSKIEVVGMLMPNKIAVGSFDECDTYLTLLQEGGQ